MRVIIAYILSVIVAIMIIGWVSGVLYIVTKGRIFKRFYHDVFEWHLPDENGSAEYNGANIHCYCKFCHKEITQDSQGNWYEIDL